MVLRREHLGFTSLMAYLVPSAQLAEEGEHVAFYPLFVGWFFRILWFSCSQTENVLLQGGGGHGM